MPDRQLTDRELVSVFDNPKADLSLLTSAEQARLVKLTAHLDGDTQKAPPAAPSNLDRLLAMIPSTDTMVNAIPSVTGAAGGLMGGISGTLAGAGMGGVPGAMVGAALGGSIGKSTKDVINYYRGSPDVPKTALDAVLGLGKEAVTQGGMEAAGAGLGAGAKVVGKALMENAVRPSMGLVREFPNVVDTLVKERLPVGKFLPGMQKGSERAAKKLGAAAQSVKALLAKATADGSQIATDEVATPVLALIDDLAKQPLADAEEKQLGSMIDEFLRRHKGPLTPSAVKELKQQAQAIAKPIYKAAEKGFPVTADQTMKARFNSAIASGSKDALERLPDVGAAVGAGEKRTQDMIGAVRALKSSENRRLSLMAEGASVALGSGLGSAVSELLGPDSQLDSGLKKSVVGWAVTRGLLSPRSMSRGSLVVTHKAALEILRQFPRVALELTGRPQTTTPGVQ